MRLGARDQHLESRPRVSDQARFDGKPQPDARGVTVETGRFRAHMDVELVNDGPVTLIVDTATS